MKIFRGSAPRCDEPSAQRADVFHRVLTLAAIGRMQVRSSVPIAAPNVRIEQRDATRRQVLRVRVVPGAILFLGSAVNIEQHGQLAAVVLWPKVPRGNHCTVEAAHVYDLRFDETCRRDAVEIRAENLRRLVRE
jgi:hypothetical protein